MLLNRAGLSEKTTMQFCQQEFDLAFSEIQRTISSAYKHNFNEHALFSHSQRPKANGQKPAKDQPNISELLLNTPLIPDRVYNSLPDLLAEACNVFDDHGCVSYRCHYGLEWLHSFCRRHLQPDSMLPESFFFYHRTGSRLTNIQTCDFSG